MKRMDTVTIFPSLSEQETEECLQAQDSMMLSKLLYIYDRLDCFNNTVLIWITMNITMNIYIYIYTVCVCKSLHACLHLHRAAESENVTYFIEMYSKGSVVHQHCEFRVTRLMCTH